MKDLVIIGSGPAGLSAAVYAYRGMLDVTVVEKQPFSGGQIVNTEQVDNYLGLCGINGFDMGMKFREHVDSFNVPFTEGEVIGIEQLADKKGFKLTLDNNDTIETKTVLIATGASHKKLGLEGENKFAGAGVSYCATCDANFFRDLEVYVAGGGDAAVEEAIYLTRFARKVTIIHRRDKLRAVKAIQERAFSNPKIDFLWDSVVEEVHGAGILQGLTVRNVKTGEKKQIESDPKDGMIGLFGFVGNIPNSALFQRILDMDENGYIRADEEMQTSVTGVYVAGDIRVKSVRQVVTAAADGAIAAVHISGKCN